MNEYAPPAGRRLSDELPRALGGGEITVLFQPQISMATGAIVGVEALARWRHPRYGAVGAERLLAAADRGNLVVELSDAIHQAALSEAAAWPSELRDLRLSINVTARDIARDGFAAQLIARAASCGFAMSRLTVELTEHDLVADLVHASFVLAELRDTGCHTAIDDFGTGYSSLSYLKALPLDIEGTVRDQVIVRAVIALARALDLTVIVEGVETQAQRDLLAGAGADIYQGFLFSEPTDTAGLARLIQATNAPA